LIDFASEIPGSKQQRSSHSDVEDRPERLTADKASALLEWRWILLEYNKRDLTKFSDSLSAISGIASCFAAILGKYCSGLWECDWRNQLLWELSAAQPKPRRLENHAPSWSWAAVDSILSFRSESYSLDERDETFSVISYQDYVPGAGQTNEGFTCASLTVRGRVNPAFWKYHGGGIYSGWSELTKQNDSIDDESCMMILMKPDAIERQIRADDTPPVCDINSPLATDDTLPVPVFILKLLDYPIIKGLVLKKHESGLFSRLGTFSVQQRTRYSGRGERPRDSRDYFADLAAYNQEIKWLDACQPQTITLI
jgi:hypothetical protein